jgi:O-antigen ligase
MLTLTLSRSESPTRVQAANESAIPWAATILLGLVFFVTEHSLTISRLDAYTQTAEEMEVTAMGGNTSRQLAYLTLAAFGIYQLARPGRFRFRPSWPALFAVGALLGWCAMSVLWSAEFGLTARRLVVLACCVIGVAGLIKQYSARQLMHIPIVLCTAFLALGVLAELGLGTFRPWGGEYRFSGSLHPNTQSANLAALCIATYCAARGENQNRKRYWALFAIGFLFLLLTKSRTALAGVVVAMSYLWVGGTTLRTKALTGFAGLWLASTAGLLVLFASSDAGDLVTDMALMGRNDQAESLSERVPLWTALSRYVKERPMLGYGFESFWSTSRIDTIADEMQWGIREAHNSYLEAILSVGIIGMLCGVSAVISGIVLATRRFWRTGEPAYGYMAGFLVFGLVDASMESGMVSPIFATFLAASALVHAACSARCTATQTISQRLAPTGS